MKKLIEMMIDEKTAPSHYMKLRKQLKSSRDKAIISSIIRDERKHLRKLKGIKRRLK
jgi:rubrerythrin